MVYIVTQKKTWAKMKKNESHLARVPNDNKISYYFGATNIGNKLFIVGGFQPEKRVKNDAIRSLDFNGVYP